MSTRRFLIGAGVALIVVVMGLVWQGQWFLEDSGIEKNQSTQRAEPESSQPVDWSVVPEASVDIGEEGETVETDTEYQRFDVPGQVTFDQSSPESVRLRISILPASPSELEQAREQRNPGGSFASPRVEMDSLLDKEPIEQFLKTDTGGQFEIKNAPPGLYSVTTSDSVWTGQLGQPDIQIPDEVAPIEFPVRQYARLVGTVVNSNENPVANAEVVDGTGDHVTNTNEQGRFVIPQLIPGRALSNYSIKKSGFSSNPLSLAAFEPGEERRETFRLNRTATLNVVVNKSDGALEGGTVVAKATEDEITRRQPIDDVRGEATFDDLPPAQYRLALSHPSIQSDVQSVTLDPDETASVALRARKRLPVTLSTTGSQSQPMRLIPPTVSVFDENGDELRPGFQLENVQPDGTFRGTLHPEMKRAVAAFDTEVIEGEQAKFEFRRSDLPEVQFDLRPAGSSSEKPGKKGELLLELASSTFNWEKLSLAKLNVINRNTHSLAMGKGGRNNPFQDPIMLPAGSYDLYGVLETDDDLQVFNETVNIESGQSVGKDLILRAPARVSGTIRYRGGDAGTLRVGLRFGEVEDSKDEQQVSYYPSELQTGVSEDGHFTLNRVPPGAELILEVSTTDETKTEFQSGTVIEQYRIGQLTEGEEKRLESVVVRP